MTNTGDDINQIEPKSPDFKTELAKKIQDLAPEAIADGKVDVKKLQELLAEDAGDDTERFGLFWPGKKQAIKAAQLPTTATLKPAAELSKDWNTTQNIFIEGDNLEVLKVLQKQYHGRIKMIYIDPPYNTGKDFVYPDNYKEGLQNYLEFTKQLDAGGKKISTNSDTDGRYHSHWLNMMYPRLKLARNLLSDDGLMFVSIGEEEVDNLRKLCSEIFGEKNQLESIVWKKRATPPNDRSIGRIHEYILVFSRNIEKVKLGLLPRDKASKERYSNPDSDPRGLWVASDLSANGKGGRLSKSTIYPIKNPRDGKEYLPSEGRCWLFGKEKMSQYIKEGRVVFREGTGTPYLKRYLNEVRDGLTLPTILLDAGFSSTSAAEVNGLFDGRAVFEYPKPTQLLRNFITIGTSKDCTILDFFSGSGTTAHAVMQLNAEDGGNRKHIQVQLPEPTADDSEANKAGYKTIAEIARERINRAGEKIKKDFKEQLSKREKPLDIGYRTYKLADTNFTKWHSEYTEDANDLQQRLDIMRESSNDDATEEDLLTEIILKLGLEITVKVEKVEIEGLTYYRLADTKLVYLNEHQKPSLQQLRTATETLPSQFVILEDAFVGDSQLKTNLAQICKTYNIELWTI